MDNKHAILAKIHQQNERILQTLERLEARLIALECQRCPPPLPEQPAAVNDPAVLRMRAALLDSADPSQRGRELVSIAQMVATIGDIAPAPPPGPLLD